jgi:hypothetical protein
MSATIILIITSSSTRNIDPPDVRAAPIHGILEIREIRIANIDIGRNLDLPGNGVRWNTNSKCMFPGIGVFVPSHSPVADKPVRRISSSCRFFRDSEL